MLFFSRFNRIFSSRHKSLAVHCLFFWVVSFDVFSLSESQIPTASLLTGAIEGRFQVDDQGAANYVVPLKVAPGTASWQPNLSLNYSSNNGNGLVGIGWSIGGLSAISRCPKTIAQDGSVGGINLSANDRFCLDGQRLILISGVYGSSGSQYRTEIDSYRVITANGGVQGSPDSFTVENKDGSSLVYGAGISKHYINNKIVSWAIGLAKDKNTNPIKFTYLNDADGFRISRIDYAYGTNQSAYGDGNSTVYFDYEDRADINISYLLGEKIVQKKRLSEIILSVASNEYKRYKAIYASSEGPSVIKNIYECAPNNTCLKPLDFSVDRPAKGFEPGLVVGSIFSKEKITARSVDFNLDGKTDLVFAIIDYANTPKLMTAIANGSGFDFATSNVPLSSITDAEGYQLLDYNQDGYVDVMVSVNTSWVVYLGNANGFSEIQINTGIAADPQATRLVDYNGDGVLDMLEISSTKSNVRFGSLIAENGFKSIGFSQAITQLNRSNIPMIGANRSFESYGQIAGFLDYDADGLVDIVGRDLYGAGRLKSEVFSLYRNAESSLNGISNFTAHSLWDQWTNYSHMQIEDLNNDGLQDVMLGVTHRNYFNGYNTNSLTMFINTGNGFNEPVDMNISLTSSPYSPYGAPYKNYLLVDFDRDGYNDLIHREGWLNSTYANNLVLHTYNLASEKYDDQGLPSIFASQLLDQIGSFEKIDIEGDGNPDILQIATPNLNTNATFTVYKSSQIGIYNLINKIDNGLGGVTTISYKPLNDTSVYQADHDANTVDWAQPASTSTLGKNSLVNDIFSGAYVVAETSVAVASAGSQPGFVSQNAKSIEQFFYQGAKVQVDRGHLGFRKITRKNIQNNGTVEREFRQDFPFVGLLQKETSRIDGISISQDILNYDYNQVAAVDETKYYRVNLTNKTSQAIEKNSSAEISFEDIVYDTDMYGNIISEIQKIYGDASHITPLRTVTTTRQYNSDTSKRYGLLDRMTVNFERPDTESVLRKTTFAYINPGASNALLQSEIIEPDDVSLKHITTYVYDSMGNRLRETQSVQNMSDRYTRWEYDVFGRFIDRTYGLYKKQNNTAGQELAVESVLLRNSYGLPLQIKNANGLIANYAYDELGREISHSDNTGAAKTTNYSQESLQLGAQYKIVEQANTGNKVETYYDGLNRVIAQAQKGFDGRMIWTQHEYDLLGNLRFRSIPYYTGDQVYWLKTDYDHLSRKISEIAADNSVTNFTYNGVDFTSTNAMSQAKLEKRNALGELELVRDPLGGEQYYFYSADGQLTKTETWDPVTQKDIYTYMSYDRLGRKTSMMDPDKGTWFYQYNAFGELTRQYKLTTTSYFLAGLQEAIAQNTPMQRSELNYDHQGRLIERKDYRVDNSVEGVSTWQYDTAANGVGQLASSTYGGKFTGFGYDELGRVIARYTFDTQMAQEIDTVFTEYDEYGRVSYSYTNNATTYWERFHYNAQGYLQRVHEEISDHLLYEIKAMDARGNVTEKLLGNGYTTMQIFDPATSHLLKQEASNGLTVLQKMDYQWDVLGNLTSKQDRSKQNGTALNQQQSFCYDGLNRLVKTHTGTLTGSCSLAASQQDTEFDGLGNITRKADVGTYSYGIDTRLPHAVKNAGGTSYSYDMNGNLISDSSGRTLRYTTFDQAEKITYGNAEYRFAFDENRQRFRKQEVKKNTGVILSTTWYGNDREVVKKSDGSYVIKQYFGDEALWTYTLNAQGVQTGLTQQFIYRDSLGSVVRMTDASGNSDTQAWNFSPWGERTPYSDWSTLLTSWYKGAWGLQSQVVSTQQGFTGHEMLDSVGLIHMNGRIYDQKLGRFVQADPIIQAPDDTQSFNRYSYVRNNPLNATDPSGFCGGSGTGGWACMGSEFEFGKTTYYLDGSHAYGLTGSSFGGSGWVSIESGNQSSNLGMNSSGSADLVVMASSGGWHDRGGQWGGTNSAGDVIVNAYSSQWISDGNTDLMSQYVGSVLPANYFEGTLAVYGETGSLYPQTKQPSQNPYNPKNWNEYSYLKLQVARQLIADIRERNKITNMKYGGSSSNKIELKAWADSVGAAKNALNFNLSSDVRHFYLRQDGVGSQKPNWAENLNPYMSFGPFINVGGGDVPRGNNTYIDIYKGVK